MTFGELALLISVVGTLPYMWLIMKGRVKPHRTSWFIWTLILILSVIGYRAAGAGDSLFYVVGELIATGGVFILSIWQGKGGYERQDIICLLVALSGILLWQLSGIPTVALVAVIGADIMGVIPTIKSALREPETENSTTFIASTLAGAFGIVAVGEWNAGLLFYPIYLFLVNFVTSLVILVSQYQVRYHAVSIKQITE